MVEALPSRSYVCSPANFTAIAADHSSRGRRAIRAATDRDDDRCRVGLSTLASGNILVQAINWRLRRHLQGSHIVLASEGVHHPNNCESTRRPGVTAEAP
jgi:hypothetical protein